MIKKRCYLFACFCRVIPLCFILKYTTNLVFFCDFFSLSSLSLVSFICLFTLMLQSHIHSIFAVKKSEAFCHRSHHFVDTKCDNNQWNFFIFICILTRIASIFRTKIKEKRQNRINTCFLHHDFNVASCFFLL